MNERLVRPVGRDTTPAPTGRGAGADVWAWIGVALCTAAAMLAGLVESLLIPLYVGSVVIPLAPVLAIATNVVLVAAGRAGVQRALGGVLPLVGWLVPVLVLSGIRRPEGDVIYPGGSGLLPWVSYGVVLCGGLAGAAALVLTAPLPPRADGSERPGPRRGSA